MKINRIIFFIILVVASGCSMQTYCDKRFPAKEYTTIDTVTRVECWYDTIYIPETIVSIDTVIKEIPFDFVFHKTEKKNGLTASVDIAKGKITFRCAEDSLRAIIQHQKEVIRISREKLQVKTAQCSLPHKTKFNYFCSYWFWLTFGIILIAIILKLAKFI